MQRVSLRRPGYPKLLVIVGPTGVGKTTLSLELAARFGGEIVSADSRLFYRGMDVGTDKPDPEARVQIAHHLIDICQPGETLSLGQYKRMAMSAITSVQARRRLPLLVGGTGQYVRAIVEGWQIPEIAPHTMLRDILATLDGAELHRWLSVLDPVSAANIDARNGRRVIRALEVTLVSGRPMSEMQGKVPPEFDIMMLGLHCDRETLYQRIDARVDTMLANGLINEVKGLRDQGYERDLPAMSGLGYRQVWAYLDSEMTLVEAVERIKFETHRFARQQHNWFRRDDSRIRWYDIQEPEWHSRLYADVQQFSSQTDVEQQ
jgi:tRNA dimethylallyltransferase